jgi:cytochrome c553
MLKTSRPLPQVKSGSILIILWALSVLPLQVMAEMSSDKANLIEQGRRIYQEGILTSGAELTGSRTGNISLKGAQAACINCHRHSGMGSVEGDILIPPITGNYLFNPDKIQVSTMDPRSGKKFNQTHPAYTEGSLAAAIATGTNNAGLKMQALMPNYPLDKKDMAALSAYLKQLSTTWSSGVDGETIHLATVITPEVAPERRKAFLDTLQKAIIQKNGSTLTSSSLRGRHHMASAADLVLGTERKWVLHIWDLQGTPDTWTAQLNEKLKAQPVFTVLSGLSDNTWEPVHNFCETNHIPCWFPSVPLPVTSQSFYGLYFSKGVLLEADVLAQTLIEKNQAKRVVQVHRNDEVSSTAAKHLSESLVKAGISTEDRIIKEGDIVTAESVAKVNSDEVIMFWLRGKDLVNLDKFTPPEAKALYFSGKLTGAGQNIPKAWQAKAQVIYPYELPEKRQSNLTNFHAWLKSKKLPLVDEPLQAEAFFAVEFLTETLSEMLDNIYRDFLVERAESMLSKSDTVKSEQQIRERQMRGKTGASILQKSTSIYPRLGLGVKQRFASKGAYLMHFDKDGKLVAESDWLVP